MDALQALTSRRSPPKLIEPAPSDEQLSEILAAAIRAPDHGRLRPWRFILLRGEARERLGTVLADALKARAPDVPDDALARERQKPLRAPLMVVVAASLVEGHKIPVIEQVLAAGAAAQNLVVAAHAMGFGAMWRTGEPAYDTRVKTALGLAPGDAIVGFMYLGTPQGRPAIPPNEPGVKDFVREWSGAAG
ncbi:MAG TPA: nitroreductase [Stellaceae bacterium]|nr:nitroreductase [Stellaceae bacterium]